MKSLSFAMVGASLLAAGSFISMGAAGPSRTGGMVERIGTGQGSGVMAEADRGVWDLSWDDKVNDSLDPQPKKCRVKLDFLGMKVEGSFEGRVLEEKAEREAQFAGKLIGAEKPALLLLEQKEKGYTCVYQMQVTGQGYSGVWHDTRGGKGDVELRRAAGDKQQ